MAIVAWGAQPKSQFDNETIEEAIARLIAVHMADEASHLGVGESLQSHKASSIIDHLAASIVADKLADISVEPRSININKLQICPVFESLDAWEPWGDGGAGCGVGCAWINTLSDAASYKKIMSGVSALDLDLSVQNSLVEFILEFSHNTSQEAFFGFGEVGSEFFGFKVLNGVLYAVVDDNYVNPHTDELPAIDVRLWHSYRAILTCGSKIEFYVDDVLVHTETTYFPGPGSINKGLYLSIANSSAFSRQLVFTHARFFCDK